MNAWNCLKRLWADVTVVLRPRVCTFLQRATSVCGHSIIITAAITTTANNNANSNKHIISPHFLTYSPINRNTFIDFVPSYIVHLVFEGELQGKDW